jgi:NADPH2:quinone reductase
MRAVVYRTPGDAKDVLELVTLEDPTPGPGDVRVKMVVSGVNPTDFKSRSRTDALPFDYQIPNQDGAGVIDAVGDGVDPSRVGERVWVYHAAFNRAGGTAAEYVCLPAIQAVPLPEQVSFARGAGLGIPYLTAHYCLFENGPIDGKTVLVTGGAGAVGNAAIQLAVAHGAHVIATVSSDAKGELARQAGAHAIVNYRNQDVTTALRDAAPHGIDRVVEVALAQNLDAILPVLNPFAQVVTYASDNVPEALYIRPLMGALVTLKFMLVYHLPQALLDQGIADVTALLASGVVSVLPEKHYALEDTWQAHKAVEDAFVGKVLIDIQDA